ncbi:MAG: homoserine O-acetyltransferase, partial [Rhodospirillales bacterium]|nr:homoserine O-acetyltransferase [Rhodospirillales bacterium]
MVRSKTATQALGTGDGYPLPGYRVLLGCEAPLKLDCGIELRDFSVAYQIYGRMNEAKSNVILACHALTGDQFAAEVHPITGKTGWWHEMIG